MKKTFSSIFLILFSLLAFGQENIFVQFDKNMHVLGERIWFKADLVPIEKDFLPAEKLRVELISPKGNTMVNKHLKIENGQTCGQIDIELNWQEGWYTLLAYTVWGPAPQIRNYTEIKIPIYDDFKKREINVANKTQSENILNNNNSFALTIEKKEIKRRGNIELNILGEKNQNKTVAVTVMPKELFYFFPNYELSQQVAAADFSQLTPEKANVNYGQLPPEINKSKLLGLIAYFPKKDQILQAPLNGNGIFTIENNWPEEQVFQTVGLFNKDGELFYELIQTNYLDLKNSIKISQKNSSLPLTPQVLDYLEQSRQRKKYNAIFQKINTTSLPQTTEQEKQFSPDASYVLEKYAAMTNLKEFIREVIPFIRLKEKNEIIDLRMFNEKKVYFKNAPIFILDGHIVSELEDILAIPVEDVERVDVFRTTEILKSQFGVLGNYGVVAFYTKKGNQQLKNTPTLTSQGLNKGQTFSSPDHKNSRLPDFRNLIYWHPAVPLTNGSAKIDFSHSDDVGEFIILVSAINETGKMESSLLEYSVK